METNSFSNILININLTFAVNLFIYSASVFGAFTLINNLIKPLFEKFIEFIFFKLKVKYKHSCEITNYLKNQITILCSEASTNQYLKKPRESEHINHIGTLLDISKDRKTIDAYNSFVNNWIMCAQRNSSINISPDNDSHDEIKFLVELKQSAEESRQELLKIIIKW